MSQAASDLDRRIANVLRYGTVASLSGDRVTVKLDENTTTAPLKWFAPRAGDDREWWAPEPGEQVMVFSPSGEISQGTVMPGIFSTAHPANASAKTVHRVTYKDGTVVEYDREAGKYAVTMPSGTLRLQVGSSYLEITPSGIKLSAARIDLN